MAEHMKSTLALFAFLLLLLAHLAFSLSYKEPPIENMSRLNSEALANPQAMQSNFLSGLQKSTATVGDPIEAAGAKLIKLDPSVDDAVSDGLPPKVIWVWAESHAQSVSQSPDLQKCSDGITLDFKERTISALFNFSLGSQSRTSASTELMLDVPFSAQELGAAGPYENLSVTLDSELDFIYGKTTYHYVYLPCSEGGGKDICVPECVLYSINAGEANFSRKFHSAMNYTVESGQVLFFLSKPVLGEQWYRNNLFDALAFSKRIFYKAVAKMNDEEIGNATSYLFDFYNDSLGIYYIKTVGDRKGNNSILAEHRSIFYPKTIENASDRFSYLYEINSSYSGIGKNNLTVILFDRFGKSFRKTYEIKSRALTYGGNKVEAISSKLDAGDKEGLWSGVLSPENARPSAPYLQNNLTSVIIGIGILGIFLFIVFRKVF